MSNVFLEKIGAMLIPMLEDYAIGQLPDAAKRLLFVNLAALGSEGQTWLKKTATGLDDAVFNALVSDANASFAEAGKADLAAWLDQFVAFKVT